MRNIDRREPIDGGDSGFRGDAPRQLPTTPELPPTPVPAPAPEKTGMSTFTKLLIGVAIIVALILIF